MGNVLTLEEMRAAYKDEWAIVVDCEYDEAGWLVRGRVAEHSVRRSDVYKAMSDHPEGGAVEYFGKIPEDVTIIL